MTGRAIGLVHEPVSPDDQSRFGAKAAGLRKMASRKLRVPPGLLLEVAPPGTRLSEAEWDQLRVRLGTVVGSNGGRFGDPDRPLMLAVRASGPMSMPGVMATIVGVGAVGKCARALRQELRSRRALCEAQLAFLEGYATSALGMDPLAFAALRGRPLSERPEDELESLVSQYERLMTEPIPIDPFEQLRSCVDAVVASFDSEAARRFRSDHEIEAIGTGVIVMPMIMGNAGEHSGAGVVLSRHPSSGEALLYGEWRSSAFGSEIVGARAPVLPVSDRQLRRGQQGRTLEKEWPTVYSELKTAAIQLERASKTPQEIEFAVERGVGWLLQCRPARCTPKAYAKIAIDMVEAGYAERHEAIRLLPNDQLQQLVRLRFPDPEQLAANGLEPIARALAASSGAASGMVTFHGNSVLAAADPSRLIFVRSETNAEDVALMRQVAAIVTAAGGLTSHAAVVARAAGIPCLAGASELDVDYQRGLARLRSTQEIIREGDTLSIDGDRGLIYRGYLPAEPQIDPAVETLLAWADELRTVRIFVEAYEEVDARVGMKLGADGVFPRFAFDADDAKLHALGPLLSADDAEGAQVGRYDRDTARAWARGGQAPEVWLVDRRSLASARLAAGQMAGITATTKG